MGLPRETVFDACREVSRPRRFLRSAWHDLRRSPRIGWQLFRANLKAGRRRSLFGYLWLLLPAATTALVSVYLQHRAIVAVAPTVLPYALHVLAGMVLWQAFLDALNAPLQQLGGARQLVTRSMVPHEAVLLAGLFEVGLAAAIRLVFLVLFLVVTGFVPTPSALLLLPLGLGFLAVLGMAIGLIVTPLGLLYDDVRKGLGVGTTLWFFLTPVLFPAPASGPLRFNPVTPLLDAARGSLAGQPLQADCIALATASLVLLAAAWLGYRLARPHLIERMG
jgi:lipopolysaccharide transport system permease protein